MVLAAENDNRISLLLWRSPFWMYLLMAGSIIACYRKRNLRGLLVIAPPLLATLPLVILFLGKIFRYVYSMYLVGILFSAYFWMEAFSASPET